MNYLVRRPRRHLQPRRARSATSTACGIPYTDLEINCRSQLSILEACRRNNPGVKVVFAGTRQVYGKPDSLPVDRAAPGAADRRQRHQQGGRRVLPPRLQQRVRRARLLAAADQHLRPAPADQAQPPGLHRLVHPPGRRRTGRSQIFGDGSQLRDFVYVDDAADAFLRAGASDACNGEVFNVGGAEPDQPSRPGRTCCSRWRAPAACRYVEWPAEKKAIDIGSFYADSSEVHGRHRLGSRASTLREGLRPDRRVYRRAPAPLPRPPSERTGRTG